MNSIKIYSQVILFLLFSGNIFSQSWIQLPSFPDSIGWYGASAFSINGKGYFGATGARDVEIGTDLYEFNPTNNTWSLKSTFPGNVRRISAYFSIGNYGYIFAGDTNKVPVYTGWRYDPSNNTWTQMQTYPGIAGRVPIFGSINGKGYVGGGLTGVGGAQKDWWEYNPANNSWTKKSDFPFGVRAGASTFSIDSLIYVVMGRDETTNKKDLWAYNPSNNSWTQKANYPGLGRMHPVSFVVNGKAVVGGGHVLFSPTTVIDDYYIYNPATNTWDSVPGFSSERRSMSSYITINNEGYICMGTYNKGGVDTMLNDFWKYNDTIKYLGLEYAKYPEEIKIDVFPNPTTNEFTLRTSQRIENAVIKIRDISGRLILSRKLNLIERCLFEIPGDAGLYFIEVEDQSTFRKTLIISKI